LSHYGSSFPVIQVRAKKKLGDFLLDAELRDEGFTCLVGSNGSGKTTFLNLIAGLLKLDEGYVKINDKTVSDLPPEERQTVLVTPDSCIPNLSVNDHLVWGAKINKIQIQDHLLAEAKEKLGINFTGKVSKLSLGMRERTSLATALLSQPKLILVDEAFSNIHNKQAFMESFKELALRSKIDVIFSTQHFEDRIHADHVYRMENGRAIKQ
jgi:molybdate/tungstate transport system ATP-binding protein